MTPQELTKQIEEVLALADKATPGPWTVDAKREKESRESDWESTFISTPDHPAGRRLFRLVPSMRPTAEIDFGLWPTPDAGAFGATTDVPKMLERRVQCKAKHGNNGFGLTLGNAAALALWPTPTARDWRSEKATQEFYEKVRACPRGKSLPMMLALWPTPTSLAHAKNGNNEAGNSAELVAIRGLVPSGSSGTTEKPGALNPAFPCWLMGFPPEWDACAPTVTRSSRKLRKPLSNA